MQSIRVAAVSMNAVFDRLDKILDEMIVVEFDAQRIAKERSLPSDMLRTRRPGYTVNWCGMR